MDLKEYTILIVDDEEDLRDSMVFDFKRKGFTVLTAENGVKAFELIKNNTIHFVISDMRMPGGDGMDLLEKIRAKDPKLPFVILVTGYADATEAECLAKGALKVIVKPYDRKILMSSVLEALKITEPGRVT
jgi:DNA-binding NtrC family response regulator